MDTPYLALVRQAKNCPVQFKLGERMLFHLPGIGKDESDRICALAAIDLIPVIHRMDKAGGTRSRAALEIGRSNFCTGCKAERAFVEFEIVPATVTRLSGRQGPLAGRDPGFLALMETLKSFPAFEPLPTTSLARFITYIKTRSFTDGQVIMRRGERGDTLFLLAAGSVDVVTPDANGVEAVVATLGKGEVFGEMSLLTGEPTTATIRCRGTATCFMIGKQDFDRLLASNPALNLYFTRLLAERLKNTTSRFLQDEKGIAGDLSVIAPPELLQAFEAAKRSGLLGARNGDRSIEMYMHAGRLFRISAGGAASAEPEEAFYEFLSWKSGTFRFEPGERTEPQTFFKEMTALLLEGCRRFDEAAGSSGLG